MSKISVMPNLDQQNLLVTWDRTQTVPNLRTPPGDGGLWLDVSLRYYPPGLVLDRLAPQCI
jgi:hypothetical protein